MYTIIDFCITFSISAPTDNLFDLAEMKFHEMMYFLYYIIGIPTTEHALQNARVQELIHKTDDSYDVIVAEQFYQEAFLMLAIKYKAPVVTVGKDWFLGWFKFKLNAVNF
jgi:glucuronosyltransferase